MPVLYHNRLNLLFKTTSSTIALYLYFKLYFQKDKSICVTVFLKKSRLSKKGFYEALEKLEELGFIEKVGKGKYRLKEEDFKGTKEPFIWLSRQFLRKLITLILEKKLEPIDIEILFTFLGAISKNKKLFIFKNIEKLASYLEKPRKKIERALKRLKTKEIIEETTLYGRTVFFFNREILALIKRDFKITQAFETTASTSIASTTSTAFTSIPATTSPDLTASAISTTTTTTATSTSSTPSSTSASFSTLSSTPLTTTASTSSISSTSSSISSTSTASTSTAFVKEQIPLPEDLNPLVTPFPKDPNQLIPWIRINFDFEVRSKYEGRRWGYVQTVKKARTIQPATIPPLTLRQMISGLNGFKKDAINTAKIFVRNFWRFYPFDYSKFPEILDTILVLIPKHYNSFQYSNTNNPTEERLIKYAQSMETAKLLALTYLYAKQKDPKLQELPRYQRFFDILKERILNKDWQAFLETSYEECKDLPELKEFFNSEPSEMKFYRNTEFLYEKKLKLPYPNLQELLNLDFDFKALIEEEIKRLKQMEQFYETKDNRELIKIVLIEEEIIDTLQKGNFKSQEYVRALLHIALRYKKFYTLHPAFLNKFEPDFIDLAIRFYEEIEEIINSPPQSEPQPYEPSGSPEVFKKLFERLAKAGKEYLTDEEALYRLKELVKNPKLKKDFLKELKKISVNEIISHLDAKLLDFTENEKKSLIEEATTAKRNLSREDSFFFEYLDYMTYQIVKYAMLFNHPKYKLLASSLENEPFDKRWIECFREIYQIIKPILSVTTTYQLPPPPPRKPNPKILKILNKPKNFSDAYLYWLEMSNATSISLTL